MKTKLVKSKTGTTVRKHSVAGNKYILYLYIAGKTRNAITALSNLNLICKEQLKGKYNIKVIDLLKNPELCRADQIIAIPTLMRKLPLPVKWVIGNLANTQKVLDGLNLNVYC